MYACWELPCLLEFLRRSVFEHVVRWEGCAVLSKRAWRLEEHSAPRHPLERAPGFSFNRPRYLTVKVAREEQPGEALFYLTCIHLGRNSHGGHSTRHDSGPVTMFAAVPKYSDLRHEEIIRISEDLGSLAARREAQLWCGDFNTLSRGDYTAAEWAEILRVRRDNGRRDPDPDNNVIQTIHSLGFTARKYKYITIIILSHNVVKILYFIICVPGQLGGGGAAGAAHHEQVRHAG